MKSHVAPTISVLLFIFHTTNTAPPDIDMTFFKQRAITIWITKTFLDLYTSQLLPLPEDVKSGEQVYKSLVNPDFQPRRLSGALQDLDGAHVKTVLDKWVEAGLISKAQGEEFKGVLEPGSHKVVSSTIFKRPTKTFVYGVIGIARVSSSSFTVPYAFTTFKFKSSEVEVSESRQDGDCKLWGICCSTLFSLKDVDLEGGSFSFFEFLRDGAIRDFISSNSATQISYANTEATRYERFFPTEALKQVKQLYDHSNEGKVWDQILTEDPLQWDKLKVHLEDS